MHNAHYKVGSQQEIIFQWRKLRNRPHPEIKHVLRNFGHTNVVKDLAIISQAIQLAAWRLSLIPSFPKWFDAFAFFTYFFTTPLSGRLQSFVLSLAFFFPQVLIGTNLRDAGHRQGPKAPSNVVDVPMITPKCAVT